MFGLEIIEVVGCGEDGAGIVSKLFLPFAGNGISMTHAHYMPSESGFWDFTWSEMGKYDLPSQLSYVRNYTGSSTVSYIGHSQGGREEEAKSS